MKAGLFCIGSVRYHSTESGKTPGKSNISSGNVFRIAPPTNMYHLKLGIVSLKEERGPRCDLFYGNLLGKVFALGEGYKD